MGATGAVTWIHKITTKPVVRGIMLGLGLSFMVQGLNMMKQEPLLAIGAAILALLLLNSRRYPAMLILLAYGVVLALIQKPALLADLSHISIRFRLPHVGIPRMSWSELLAGCVILGLPQAPLTLGNAVIGTVAENNQYFPDRPVTARQVSVHHGVMNLIAACIGGIPMCHGAGGMAGHIRFGARTGGALVMLGLIVLFTGLFLGDSVSVILQFFPSSVLGVILFFAGVELALVVRDVRLKERSLRSPRHGWHCDVEHGGGLSGGAPSLLRPEPSMDQGIGAGQAHLERGLGKAVECALPPRDSPSRKKSIAPHSGPRSPQPPRYPKGASLFVPESSRVFLRSPSAMHE